MGRRSAGMPCPDPGDDWAHLPRGPSSRGHRLRVHRRRTDEDVIENRGHESRRERCRRSATRANPEGGAANGRSSSTVSVDGSLAINTPSPSATANTSYSLTTVRRPARSVRPRATSRCAAGPQEVDLQLEREHVAAWRHGGPGRTPGGVIGQSRDDPRVCEAMLLMQRGRERQRSRTIPVNGFEPDAQCLEEACWLENGRDAAEPFVVGFFKHTHMSARSYPMRSPLLHSARSVHAQWS